MEPLLPADAHQVQDGFVEDAIVKVVEKDVGGAGVRQNVGVSAKGPGEEAGRVEAHGSRAGEERRGEEKMGPGQTYPCSMCSYGKGQWRCVDPVSWFSIKVEACAGLMPMRPAGRPCASASRE